MAVVEEEIPEGGLESPPEHTLFIIPKNWNPRSNFGSVSSQKMASDARNQGDSRTERPYSPCYVEEEVPPEATRGAEGHQKKGKAPATSPGQTPSADEGYINLIFDVRHLLEDQVFRIAILEQRLDMFFAAHSRATPKKQCPTCGRAYAFPARWRHTEAADTLPGSEVL
jgi:hypothetical protein